MERSLILVKPDAVLKGAGTAILNRIESQGLKLIAVRMLRIDRALAERHYAAHIEKHFFPGLLAYITSAPVIAAVFEGDGAVGRIRHIMGATDPAKAETGTIRRDFGENIERNAIHGSDSPETARNEIALFFEEGQLMHYERS